MMEKWINQTEETHLLEEMGNQLQNAGFHSGNCCIVTIGPDRSSIVGQYLRHRLGGDGKICDGFVVDIPDGIWDERYQYGLQQAFTGAMPILRMKTPILVKSRVLHGEHYRWITDWMKKYLAFDKKIITLALYENLESGFKSDFVGEYYGDEEIRFWWEQK